MRMQWKIHCDTCPPLSERKINEYERNELCDSFANLVSDVCHDIEIEPTLQPLQGETFILKSTTTDDDARLDIKSSICCESF